MTASYWAYYLVALMENLMGARMVDYWARKKADGLERNSAESSVDMKDEMMVALLVAAMEVKKAE